MEGGYASAKSATGDSLGGISARALSQADVLKGINNLLEDCVTRVCGSMPHKPTDAPQPVANGLLEELNMHQGEMQTQLSRLQNLFDRLNNKL
jgi:hypothetical protein